ncbi:MAG: glycosyltransferase [Alphaproteobacteria bacterium]|nr:glycosyltransferase [Alphaproteobacteria bacterium]
MALGEVTGRQGTGSVSRSDAVAPDTQSACSLDILMCTFRRPELGVALDSLEQQSLPANVQVRVIIADNDETPSARELVEARAATFRFPLIYVHAPARNISIARNACLDAADADWVAFIDDDEIAEPDWLAELLKRAGETGAEAVFGPSYTIYDDGSPAWMRRQDHHSNIPVRRGDIVETGHTCNALVKFRGGHAQTLRFNVSRGQFQGEDVEYFFNLYREGALLEIAENAIVREPVAASRLNFGWIRRRKFGAGYSYAIGFKSLGERLRLIASAGAKCAICLGAAGLALPFEGSRNYWALRGAFHAGIVAGCLGLKERKLYGG